MDYQLIFIRTEGEKDVWQWLLRTEDEPDILGGAFPSLGLAFADAQDWLKSEGIAT